MLSDVFNNKIKGFYERASIPKINRAQLFSIDFPKPSLKIQHEVVAKIEVERKVVDGCQELIKRYEVRIKRVVDGVWGERI
jgi:type I restriction enzyme M protein